MVAWLNNIYFWMIMTFVFLLLFILLFILVIVMAKKTHATVELRAWLSGKPIGLFFQENRYMHWEPVKPDAGILTHKHYGAFIINEKATYIDKRTKNVMLPFDAQFGAGINIHAASLVDTFQYVMQDEEQMRELRKAIAMNELESTEEIDAVKTTVNINALKTMMTALTPHNINAKIEKVIASRIRGFGKTNATQVLLLFGGILGAIIIGYILIKSVGGTA